MHLQFEKIIITGLYTFLSSFGWVILILLVLLILFIMRRRKKKGIEEIKSKTKERAKGLFEFLGKKE
ncbi:MAG: hypothetical protein J7L23_03950 [Candidatus Diapherotrites archaeon]|nr:hypothetical protein [Candidatus Diapherotrites archaeon]